ncbi:hypothetical protein N5P37_002316 [Trichoderma harzianum]|nr:hypothetical protein N5P37_002316 [Trichoderma harzianum]
MAVCRFYQQGYCKFGNSCRYEHPNAGGNRNQSSNRFGALGGTNTGGSESPLTKYGLGPDVIEKDLTIEAPQWILSAYAPGRDAPEQLFGGYPREQSFEELRLHYLIGKASGNEQQALNEAQQLYQNAKQQMEAAARNPMEAARFIAEAENRHPNRHDICKEGTQGAPFGEFQVGRRPNATNPFGANTATTNPFGGNPATMASTTGAFGQPSALGQKPNPFGQPSQPAFGQPSQPTSAFGQPTQTASPFSQPSQPASAFGQPSALGAKPSPFGAPAFGQPSQPNTQSSPFGQPQAQGSAFGQPSALGQKPNPFSSAAGASPSPFGQPSAPAANPFAAPAPAQNTNSSFSQQPVQNQSPFGAPANQTFAQNNASPFGQQPQPQQQQQPTVNPFAQNQTNSTSSQANPFSGAQQPPSAGAGVGSNNPYPPGSSKQHPNVESYSSRAMDGRLTMFKGKPVTYVGDVPGILAFDGTWTRIWFPKGPPGYNKDTELPIEQYSDQLKTQWAAFAETGGFADGLMPELPPPRECTQWDF